MQQLAGQFESFDESSEYEDLPETLTPTKKEVDLGVTSKNKEAADDLLREKFVEMTSSGKLTPEQQDWMREIFEDLIPAEYEYSSTKDKRKLKGDELPDCCVREIRKEQKKNQDGTDNQDYLDFIRSLNEIDGLETEVPDRKELEERINIMLNTKVRDKQRMESYVKELEELKKQVVVRGLCEVDSEEMKKTKGKNVRERKQRIF